MRHEGDDSSFWTLWHPPAAQHRGRAVDVPGRELGDRFTHRVSGNWIGLPTLKKLSNNVT
jgi:hypothetical protein